jgi:glycosyltransferase involved in cell wall biosynthesis
VSLRDVTVDPALSVVVMGYLNRSTIRDAVASVVTQRCPEPFEVLVVTSGNDGSTAILRERFPELMVIDAPYRLLPGGARNLGVGASRGMVVAFLAADCIAEPGWVDARVQAHGRGHLAVASAMTTARHQGPAAWALHFDMYCHRLVGRPAGVLGTNDPAAHGLSFDRTLLHRIGDFDDAAPIGEDTGAADRVRAAGVEIWYEPAIVTAHRGPRNFADLLREACTRSERAARNSSLPSGALDRWTVMRSFGSMWWRGVRRRAVTAWRYGTRRERFQLMLSLPWLAAARAAALAGWYSVRVRRSRTDGPVA